MKLLLVLIITILLVGCFSASRQEQTREVEVRRGTEQGKPTNLIIERREVVTEESKSGVDPAAVAALVQEAVKAAVPGAEQIAALIPKPKDPEPTKIFGMDPEIALGAAAALWGGERTVAVALKRRRLKVERKP